MPRKLFIIWIVVCISLQLNAQDTRHLTIELIPTFNGRPVLFEDEYYKLPSDDSVSFETFKCYISKIQLQQGHKTVYTEANSYHLLDAADKNTLSINLADVPQAYDELSMSIGIDSLTNVSGAMGGDLDPAKGMYWAWQSGYINMKLEGKSNLCNTRKHAFQLHLGGYKTGEYAMQQVSLTVKNTDHIRINIPLDKFVAAIDLRKQSEVMVPGKEAVEMAATFAKTLQVTE